VGKTNKFIFFLIHNSQFTIQLKQNSRVFCLNSILFLSPVSPALNSSLEKNSQFAIQTFFSRKELEIMKSSEKRRGSFPGWEKNWKHNA